MEFKATILRRRWRIIEAEGMRDRYAVDGDCDDPRTPNKAIRFDPSMGFWDTLETLAHEAHHAALPSTDHDDLTQFHRDIRRIQETATAARFVILTRAEYEQLTHHQEQMHGTGMDTSGRTTADGTRSGEEKPAGDLSGTGPDRG